VDYRCIWIDDFIGHALRRELCDDADWIADVAAELYSRLRYVDPRLAAEAAFSSESSG
jgi:hypothetical protein